MLTIFFNRLTIFILLFSSVSYTSVTSQENSFPHLEVVHVKDQIAFQDSHSLIQVVSQMLDQAGYEHDCSNITLHKGQKNQIALVDTHQGKKFIKIKKRGEGLNEYVGSCLFQQLASVIAVETLLIAPNIELVVQPFLFSANQKGLLFDAIAQLECEDQTETWNLLHSIFSDALTLSCSTLHYDVTSVKNDEFFFNRFKTQAQEGVSGRIERMYSGKNFKLMDVEVSWEELKKLKWKIDGISYQETLEELLVQARQHLHPAQSRLIGMSHGNGHENNILLLDTAPKYAYIALEFAGENDLIADAAMFLAHTTVYADYLNPMYYGKAYGNSPLVAKTLERSLLLKKREITLHQTNHQVEIKGMGSFGTLPSRKQCARFFHTHYLQPLTEHAIKLFGDNMERFIDEHLKAALLSRLLGGQDLTKMMPHDQVKMISLIYQSLGTPTHEIKQTSTFKRFMEAL